MNDGENKMANKKKMDDRHKFYEVHGVLGRGCQWESAFASSPSSTVHALPTEKKHLRSLLISASRRPFANKNK